MDMKKCGVEGGACGSGSCGSCPTSACGTGCCGHRWVKIVVKIAILGIVFWAGMQFGQERMQRHIERGFGMAPDTPINARW